MGEKKTRETILTGHVTYAQKRDPMWLRVHNECILDYYPEFSLLVKPGHSVKRCQKKAHSVKTQINMKIVIIVGHCHNSWSYIHINSYPQPLVTTPFQQKLVSVLPPT